MAIGFIVTGAGANGTTEPYALTLPTGYATGNMLVILQGHRIDTTTVVGITGVTYITPSNNTVTGGTGTEGIDSGPCRQSVFYRIATSASETAPTVDLSAAPAVRQGYVCAFTCGGDEMFDVPTVATASDTTGSTTQFGQVTGNATLDFTTGDWILAQSLFNTDSGTGPSQTLAVPGCTLGTQTATGTSTTTAGDDSRMLGWAAPINSGTASGAPTLTITYTAGATNESGTAIFMRIRVLKKPKQPYLWQPINRASFW